MVPRHFSWSCISSILVLILSPATETAFGQASADKAIDLEFSVVDQRPLIESKGKLLSMFPLSCEYFVYRLSDKKLPYGRIEQLKRDLTNLLGPKLTNMTMTVSQYTIHVNDGVAQENNRRAAGAAAIASLGGGSVSYEREAAMSPRCPREQMRYGWFDPSETTNMKPPLIADLVVSLNGQTYTVHKVISPDIDLTVRYSKTQAPYVSHIIAEVHKTLAEQIARTWQKEESDQIGTATR